MSCRRCSRHGDVSQDGRRANNCKIEKCREEERGAIVGLRTTKAQQVGFINDLLWARLRVFDRHRHGA